MGNKLDLRIDGKEIRDLPNAKVFGRHIKAGDGWTLYAGGGGGFGSPKQRDPAAVAHDVRQGYVSRANARDLYGVEVTADGHVDEGGTARLRAA